MTNLASLIILTVISSAQARDYFVTGYDCSNADFIKNLTADLMIDSPKNDVITEETTVQIIQNVETTNRVSELLLKRR